MFGALACPLASVQVGDRLRHTDPSRVEALAASISEIGLQEPIIVRSVNEEVVLVAGAHRLAAAQLLGWSEIAVSWRELTDDEARLVEIDENLIRADLSALDRAIALAKRKEVYEKLHPETVHGKAKKPRKGDDLAKVANMATFARYSKDAAAKAGLSERAVQRAVELVSKLSVDVVEDLRRSPIANNQAQLIALSDLPADEQKTCMGALVGGKATNVEAARIATQLVAPRLIDPDEIAVSRFIAIWERASPKVRKRIAAHIALAETPAKPPKAKAGT